MSKSLFVLEILTKNLIIGLEYLILEFDMDIISCLLMIVFTCVVGFVLANLLARDVVNARLNLFSISVVVSEEHTRETLEYEE